MIQRIQTVYLLAVTILLVVCLCLPIGSYIQGDNTLFDIYNLFISNGAGVTDYSNWALFVILIISAVVSFGTIFFFKKRMLQIRFTIFNTILLIGYYATILAFVFWTKTIQPFTPSLSICLPFVAIILNWLTIRAIGKDEMLVKAYDRLR